MTPNPLSPEQKALLAISRTSWRRRGVAKLRKLHFSEESVTETVLMDLAETFPGQLEILPFNKIEEGESGADWAWTISNASGMANVPMLVQAKALDFADHSYAELKRTIGKQKPAVRQIDRLLDTAQQLDWPAIYAFYNNVTDLSRLPVNCGTLPHVAQPDLQEAWGISFADAFQVRDALDPGNDQTFDSHRLHSRPLLCLLCQHGFAGTPPAGSPQAALQALRRLRATRILGDRHEAEFIREGPEPVMLAKLPPLFAITEDILRDENDARRIERTQALSADYPNLAGVMITRDRPPEG